MSGAPFLYHCAASQAHLSDTCLVDLGKFFLVDHNAACREIRSFDITHQFFVCQFRVLEQSDLSVDYLREIVRRSAGRHSHRNAFRSVDQKVGDLDGEHFRFFLVLIEVRNKIHDIFIEIRKKSFFRDLLKPRLGIAHCRGAVAFYIAEVSVAVDQGDLFFEILCHDDQRVIDRTVAVGMIFTHRIADDSGALSEGPVRSDPELMHVVKSSSLYGF